MATMNKPAYAAIQTHSPSKPVLIFVSSRRQTRLTALDIIAYAAADEKPRAFVHMEEAKLNQILLMVKDSSLRHTLQFGVGLHHAGRCRILSTCILIFPLFFYSEISFNVVLK